MKKTITIEVEADSDASMESVIRHISWKVNQGYREGFEQCSQYSYKYEVKSD